MPKKNVIDRLVDPALKADLEEQALETPELLPTLAADLRPDPSRRRTAGSGPPPAEGRLRRGRVPGRREGGSERAARYAAVKAEHEARDAVVKAPDLEVKAAAAIKVDVVKAKRERAAGR